MYVSLVLVLVMQSGHSVVSISGLGTQLGSEDKSVGSQNDYGQKDI